MESATHRTGTQVFPDWTHKLYLYGVCYFSHNFEIFFSIHKINKNGHEKDVLPPSCEDVIKYRNVKSFFMSLCRFWNKLQRLNTYRKTMATAG